MQPSAHLVAHYAEVEIRAIAKRYVANCLVGALWGGDSADQVLPILIKTKTDEERDLLIGKREMVEEFKAVFRQRGYPETDLSKIEFLFPSQETVDREFTGNWGFALR